MITNWLHEEIGKYRSGLVVIFTKPHKSWRIW
jgi:hypothetical protein